jgi:hypothetical protein
MKTLVDYRYLTANDGIELLESYPTLWVERGLSIPRRDRLDFHQTGFNPLLRRCQ